MESYFKTILGKILPEECVKLVFAEDILFNVIVKFILINILKQYIMNVLKKFCIKYISFNQCISVNFKKKKTLSSLFYCKEQIGSTCKNSKIVNAQI